jgi:hypothetical protein
VTIDPGQLLRRVVDDVFDEGVDVVYSTDPKSPTVHRVMLSDQRGGQRQAGLQASYWWFDVTIFDLGVSATLFDEDDEESKKEAALRELALLARVYLRGEGHVELRRGLIRSHPVLRILVNGREWELGRRVSTVHYP